jgi:hypothetical protein
MSLTRAALVRLAAAALVIPALAACGGADTAADTVDTAGVAGLPSGTPAGDSARAGGVPGTFMGDTTRDSILGDTARDSGTGTGTRP